MEESNQSQEAAKQSGRDVETELDRFEAKLKDLKIQYEQYFLDIISYPPDKLHEEVAKMVRTLQNAPFKNSVTRFRLRTLTQRFQTYKSHWEKVKRQRENGTYARDKFKARIRTKS